jgi:hypothetical protein
MAKDLLTLKLLSSHAPKNVVNVLLTLPFFPQDLIYDFLSLILELPIATYQDNKKYLMAIKEWADYQTK